MLGRQFVPINSEELGAGGRGATLVTGLTAGATAVAVGSSHSCAAVDDGVKCWGSDEHAQLGSSKVGYQLHPVSVTLK